MANPANASVRGTGLSGSDVTQLVTTQNLIVDVLRTLCAKLDADVGVTDANYAALITGNGAASPAKTDLI